MLIAVRVDGTCAGFGLLRVSSQHVQWEEWSVVAMVVVVVGKSK